MNRRFLTLWFFPIVGVFLTAIAIILAGAFYLEQTWFFENFGLADPSTSEIAAGWWFGITIAFLLTISFVWGNLLYYSAVLKQYEALHKIQEVWKKQSKDLKDGVGNKEECLEALAQAVPKETRIGAVLESWDDASPDSNAEYVIEGKAASCRQQLGVLQTIASILVLIGLVGNFFGLADAVKRLPELTQASSQQADLKSAAPEVRKELQTEPVKSDGKSDAERVNNRQEPAPASNEGENDATDPLKAPIEGISGGLSVVVVSSVMGIGGMALLLIFVAGFKSIFNAIVTEEIVLMTAEIGSLLRPSGGAGGGLSQEAQEAILTLPDKVDKFDVAANKITETFGKSGGDLAAIAKSLDNLLRHEMVEAKGAYDSYQKSLNQFTGVLTDERKTLEGLVQHTNSLCDGMEGLASSVRSMAEKTEESATQYQETQGKYENYLQLITKQAKERDKAYSEKIAEDEGALKETLQEITSEQRKLVQTLLEQSEKSLKKLGDTVSSQTGESFEAFREALSNKLAERHQTELEALEELISGQQEVVKELKENWKNATESQGELNSETIKAAHQSLEETSDRLLDTCDRITQTQDIALKSVVKHWQDEVAGFSEKSVASFDSNLARLVENLSGNGVSSGPAQQVTMDDLNPVLSELRDTIEKLAVLGPLEKILQALENLDREQSEEFQQVLEQLKNLKMPEEMRLSQSSIEALQGPLLELATLPSQGGNGDGPNAAILAALQSSKPRGPMEFSEESQTRLAEALGGVLRQQLQPLVDALKPSNSTLASPPANSPAVGAAWYCNACGVTNAPHSNVCSDCQLHRPQAEAATRIEAPMPDLREFVAGLEMVLQKELSQLLQPLQGLVERLEQRPLEQAKSDTKIIDLTTPIWKLEQTTERSISVLQTNLGQAVYQTNDTLSKMAAGIEKRDEKLLETLANINESLNRSEERRQEKEEASSGGLFGLFRSKTKKSDEGS
jgi:ABC-type transporter Mla subunit MlaD